MRISDWSSAVCSSDLLAGLRLARRRLADPARRDDARAARAAALHHEQPEPAVISKRHIETAAADLGSAVGEPAGVAFHPVGRPDITREIVGERLAARAAHDEADTLALTGYFSQAASRFGGPGPCGPHPYQQIARASCRDRVCANQ